MAVLQLQIRDLEGHISTRLKLLQNKPSLAMNWLSLAIAYHLKDDFDETRRVLASFKKVISENELKPFEKSEVNFNFKYKLLLYEAMLLDESKNYEELNSFLTKNENQLLELNPECQDYINFLKSAQNIDELKSGISFYEELIKKYPSSLIMKINKMKLLSPENFKNEFVVFIKPFFQKGLPSLFLELKGFYKQEEKVRIIEQVFIENEKSLSASNTFIDGDDNSNPICLLWCYMLLSQHYDYIGQFEKAIEYINKAIEHTPTLIELYLIKAKIYKHLNNFEEANRLAEKARNLDLADRYLNNKGIKYCLMNNRVEEADVLFRYFMKDEGNAHDLQTMWFEIDMGKAYLRKKEYGPALRHFKFIDKHLIDFYEDQFDFHTYCMRKYTLKSYIEMLRYENEVYENKLFKKTAGYMINGLIDYKYIKDEKDKLEAEIQEKGKPKLTPAEKKKMKKEKEKLDKIASEDPNEQMKKKFDLRGEVFLQDLKDPIEEALYWAKKVPI